MAKEIKENNPKAYDFLRPPSHPINTNGLKRAMKLSKKPQNNANALLELVEASPYANIILRADCIFSDQSVEQ